APLGTLAPVTFPGRRLLRRSRGTEQVIVLPDADSRSDAADGSATPDRSVDAATLVRQFAWSGFLGSVLIAVGAFGCGWVSIASGIGSWPLVSTVRSHPDLLFASKIVVVIGVGLLLQAWLRLGHHIRTHRVVSPRVLNRLVAWWGAPLLVAPVLFSRDVYSYIA